MSILFRRVPREAVDEFVDLHQAEYAGVEENELSEVDAVFHKMLDLMEEEDKKGENIQNDEVLQWDFRDRALKMFPTKTIRQNLALRINITLAIVKLDSN